MSAHTVPHGRKKMQTFSSRTERTDWICDLDSGCEVEKTQEVPYLEPGSPEQRLRGGEWVVLQ